MKVGPRPTHRLCPALRGWEAEAPNAESHGSGRLLRLRLQTVGCWSGPRDLLLAQPCNGGRYCGVRGHVCAAASHQNRTEAAHQRKSSPDDGERLRAILRRCRSSAPALLPHRRHRRMGIIAATGDLSICTPPISSSQRRRDSCSCSVRPAPTESPAPRHSSRPVPLVSGSLGSPCCSHLSPHDILLLISRCSRWSPFVEAAHPRV